MGSAHIQLNVHILASKGLIEDVKDDAAVF
jgi:hypothetical protein